MLVVGGSRISYKENGNFMWMCITPGSFPPIIRVVRTPALAQATVETQAIVLSSSTSSPPKIAPVNKLTPWNIHCCLYLIILTINVKVGAILVVVIIIIITFSYLLPTGKRARFRQYPHQHYCPHRKKIVSIIITNRRKGVTAIIEKKLLCPKYSVLLSAWEKRETEGKVPLRTSNTTLSPFAQALSVQQTLLICYETIMALFGMAWLLKMRSEIRSSGNKVHFG